MDPELRSNRMADPEGGPRLTELIERIEAIFQALEAAVAESRKTRLENTYEVHR